MNIRHYSSSSTTTSSSSHHYLCCGQSGHATTGYSHPRPTASQSICQGYSRQHYRYHNCHYHFHPIYPSISSYCHPVDSSASHVGSNYARYNARSSSTAARLGVEALESDPDRRQLLAVGIDDASCDLPQAREDDYEGVRSALIATIC